VLGDGFFAGQSAVATVGNTTVASGKYCHSSKHGALEYKSANINQAYAMPPAPVSSIPLLLALFLYCDPPRATSFHRRSLTAKRKRREELWAPPPLEYRKLLCLKHCTRAPGTPLRFMKSVCALRLLASEQGIWQQEHVTALRQALHNRNYRLGAGKD